MNHPEEEIERLRQALDEQTRQCCELQRQLDGANAAFEEFVSRMAHDLRQSLRDVAAFSQLLADTHPGPLDSDTTVFLERIQTGAVSMQSILSDVVDYSAVASRATQVCRTDMESVLNQAIEREARQIEQRGTIITHDPLPSLAGNFDILTRVMAHLIRNASQYGSAPYPTVHIACRHLGADPVIAVQDNGPGIDPLFHDRIFHVFERLHGREYPGHGLGLAYCRKAIEQLGGRMWVESADGAGSTFCFTLPAL
jgi:two-component system, chemotaxis family, sensor kinase Cph1